MLLIGFLLSGFLRDVWRDTPGTCVATIVTLVGFFAWIIYALSVKGYAALFGLAIWIIVSAAAMQIGVAQDL